MEKTETLSSDEGQNKYIARNGMIFYRQKEIAKGGTAKIYNCNDISDKQWVMKIPEVRSKRARKLFLKQFKFEQEWLLENSHPNIIQVIAAGNTIEENIDNENHFYVMKKCDGSLRSLLESDKTFTLDQKLEFILQLSSGLEFLERHKIIHRDLKPENILYKEVNNKYIPIIVDLGMAWMEEKGEEDDIKKREKAFPIRNKDYWAPEQYFPNATPSSKMDQWAFGYIIYEIFMNNLPRTSDNARIGSKFDVDILFDEIREKLNSEDPNNRFTDFGYVYNVLKTFINDTQSRYPNLSEMERKYHRTRLQLSRNIRENEIDNIRNQIFDYNKQNVTRLDFLGYPEYFSIKSKKLEEIFVPLAFEIDSINPDDTDSIFTKIYSIIKERNLNSQQNERLSQINDFDNITDKLKQLILFIRNIEDIELYPKIMNLIKNKYNPVVVGEVGKGKTTWLKHLTQIYMHTNDKIPLYIELKDFHDILDKNNNPKLLNLIVEYLRSMNIGYNSDLDEQVISHLIFSNSIIFLFDGLDELTNSRVRNKFVKMIEYEQSSLSLDFIITSRPVKELSILEDSGLIFLKLSSLTDFISKKFIHKWYLSQYEVKEANKYSNELINTLFNSLPAIRNLSTLPMVLTLLVIIYQKNKSLPNSLVDIYDRIIEILIQGWETEKEIEISDIDFNEFDQILQITAFEIQNNISDGGLRIDRETIRSKLIEYFRINIGGEKISQRIDIYLNAISSRPTIIIIQENYVSFWHRSFMEYLVAKSFELQFNDIETYSFLEKVMDSPEWKEVIVLYHGIQNSKGPRKINYFWDWIVNLSPNTLLYHLTYMYQNYTNLKTEKGDKLWGILLDSHTKDTIPWVIFVFHNIGTRKVPDQYASDLIEFVINNFELINKPHQTSVGLIIYSLKIILLYIFTNHMDLFESEINNSVKYKIRDQFQYFSSDQKSIVKEALLFALDLQFTNKKQYKLLFEILRSIGRQDVDVSFDHMYRSLINLRSKKVGFENITKYEALFLISNIYKYLPHYLDKIFTIIQDKGIVISKENVVEKLNDSSYFRGSLFYDKLFQNWSINGAKNMQIKIIDQINGKERLYFAKSFEIKAFHTLTIGFDELVSDLVDPIKMKSTAMYYIELEPFRIQIAVYASFNDEEKLKTNFDKLDLKMKQFDEIAGFNYSNESEVQLYENAKSKFENKKYDKSIIIAKKALKLNNRFYQAHRTIFQSYLVQKKYDKYLEKMEEVNSIWGYHETIIIDLTHALVLNKKISEGIKRFEISWKDKLPFSSALLYNNVGALYALDKQYDIAIDFYRKAIEIDQSLFITFQNLSNNLLIKRDIQSFQSLVNDFFDKNQNKVEILSLVIYLLEYYDFLEEALEYTVKIIKIDPENLAQVLSKGRLERFLGKYEVALETLDELFKKDYELFDVVLLQGKIYRSLGNKELAMEKFKTAHEFLKKEMKGKNDFQFLLLQGAVLINLFELDKAENILTDLIKIKNIDKSTFANLYYQYACLKAMREDLSETIMYMNRTIKFANNKNYYKNQFLSDPDFYKIRDTQEFKDAISTITY